MSSPTRSSHSNIMLLQTGNLHHLTSNRVVDWDWMFVSPLPSVIHHPWFIADIPGWHNDNGLSQDESESEGRDFLSDRLFLEDAIREKETERDLSLSPAIASTVSGLLHGSGERLFFQAAFHYRDIHEHFVRRFCVWTEENLRAARVQLDAVLGLYPELGGGRRCRGLGSWWVVSLSSSSISLDIEVWIERLHMINDSKELGPDIIK